LITVTAADPVSPTISDAASTATNSDSLADQTAIDGTITPPTTENATSTEELIETTDVEQTQVNNEEDATAAINFELQEVQADYNWKTVTFAQPFVNPVVVAGPPSYADSRPVTLRVRNVTSTGCQVRVDEYEFLSDKHTAETFNIIVMEKGIHTLDNDTRLEAGTFIGSTSFRQINFQQDYTQAPVILTQVLTENEVSAVTGRVRNIKKDSEGGWFCEYAMQEQERNKVSHKDEIVGYIAWEPGTGEYAGLLYEVGVTAQNVIDSPADIDFQSAFPSMPFFIAGMQTTAEADTANIRKLSVSNTTAKIKIEEETSKDKETSHTGEIVGYITIGAVNSSQ
jgi:hypothetical protein